MKYFLLRLLLVGAVALSAFVGMGLLAEANATGNELDVDGVKYAPTKVVGNGPTVHYETPDVTPQSAFTGRNTWTGNGSEHLPCSGGIHWIDNANVLTVSHCLEVPTTTTTVIITTTTTIPNQTTTTTIPTTTTSSTTVPETTTTAVVTTTTVPCDQTDPPTCLPYTGAGEVLVLVAVLGFLGVILGVASLYATKKG